MDICIHLFSASVTLAGFIAVFLVFRYRTIDTYVDARKNILISLLEKEIKKEPYIAVRIEDIGKKPLVDDIAFFSYFKNEAANKFVNDILEYRRMRKRTVWLGLASTALWGILSLFYLMILAIDPSAAGGIGCCATMTGISIGLLMSPLFLISPAALWLILWLIHFVNAYFYSTTIIGISIGLFANSLALTLFFVSFSLFAKRPE